MSYVIVRDDGAYVRPPGQEKSYGHRLEEARVFASREHAQEECCGNESVRDVEEILLHAEPPPYRERPPHRPQPTPPLDIGLLELVKRTPTPTVSELADELGVDRDDIIDALIRLGASL